MKLRMPKAALALPRAKKPAALRNLKRAYDAGRKLAETGNRRSKRES